MKHICVSELGQHWVSTCSAPSHYLNQWWLIKPLKQTSVKFESKLSIPENEFEHIVCEMVALLFRERWVKLTSSEFYHTTPLSAVFLWPPIVVTVSPWASCDIRKIAGCACAGNSGKVFPATDSCRSRYASRTCRDNAGIANPRLPLKSVAGKKFPALPAHAQPICRHI